MEKLEKFEVQKMIMTKKKVYECCLLVEFCDGRKVEV